MQEISVSSLVRYLKNKLETDDNVQKVMVVGEISNYHRHYSGHLYFSLKDEQAQINCVMFKSASQSLKFEPKNGDKVIICANTSIFESTGQMQLYVLKMNLDGLGELYAKYETLKNELTKEGYFSLEHKKTLSKKYIENVAVLVGDKSAALSDIKTMFLRRWPLVKVDYYPVLVQGNQAAESIIEKILEVDSKNYDAIILARGGGSFEDLFCFNDERLVKTIYNMNTFIVTGVGHEQDYTLVDYVSDLRAPTPTAAVELITPLIDDVINKIEVYNKSLFENINEKINKVELKYDYLLEKLLHYQDYLNTITLKIDHVIEAIKESLNHRININNKDIDNYSVKLKMHIINKINSNQMLLKRYNILLEAYNSQNVLNKGYTLIYQNNKIIKSVNELNDDKFTIKFKDGSIIASKE